METIIIGMHDFLAEPFNLGQKGFMDAVTFAFWPNIDGNRVTSQAASQSYQPW